MTTPQQLKKIHALINDLGMTDDEYRAALDSYLSTKRADQLSSKNLNEEEASRLIQKLEGLVDTTPEIRQQVYASQNQIKKIFALWHEITQEPDEKRLRNSLLTFLENHFHLHDLNHFPKKKVPKVIKALTVMLENRTHDQSKNNTQA